MPRPVYVKTEVAAERAVTDILIRKQPVVAIKCLGCNVGEKGGRITLVSVGCWDGHVYVFDVKKCPAIVYAGGLLRLLQAAQFLKVFHNCTPDCTTLMKQFGVRVNHFYDTQIAHAVIMERNGLPARRLSLRQICDSYKQSAPAVPPELERLVCEDVNVWARRPVTHAMLDLAAASVRPLVPGLFVNTDRLLPTDSNEWFTHQCDENRRKRLPVHAPPVNPHQGMQHHCCTCTNCGVTRRNMTTEYSENKSEEPQ